MPKPSVIFRTADQFRAADASPGEVLREADGVRARIEYLERGATDGALSDAEQAEVRGLVKTLDGLLNLVEDMTVIDRRGVVPVGRDGIHWGGGQDARPVREGVRGRALDVLDRTERTDGHLHRSALDAVARAVDADETDALARWVTVAGDPAYRSAFHKLVRNPQHGSFEWDDAERQAFARVQQLQRAMSLTDGAGGFMVPFSLDPAVVVTNSGTSNVRLRDAFTTKTIATDAWNGVTSAGVTAEWKAEAAEVADASPTVSQPSIPVHKGDAWIPFSFEVGGDAAAFAAEMARLLVDAKDRLEAAAFVTGTGTGQPRGIVTAAVAAGKTVATASADTLALGDLYKLKAALPARWRAQAAWLANEDIYDAVRQFDTTGSAALWAALGDNTPAALLGRRVYESSEMDGSVTAAATNHLMIYGDLRQYYVVDRVGTVVELVPHLFGANRRPTGERGFLMWFRTGADLVVPDAVRVLDA
ncbi:phage major capsid protein [Geodermatophilus sp. YIM 151500]|uniref:phage major capsid protein n=1 Tax=Geodermatophilus sp. YIM 151500 TaxID=2984531 RepID=UPI0021E36A4E|nr:phage major capsid protein [Geodermatophilus sp. YIM 151500]MCV2489449.1 phage major capsid protein [Geodermatophilus sp. YIM 151500]